MYGGGGSKLYEHAVKLDKNFSYLFTSEGHPITKCMGGGGGVSCMNTPWNSTNVSFVCCPHLRGRYDVVTVTPKMLVAIISLFGELPAPMAERFEA